MKVFTTVVAGFYCTPDFKAQDFGFLRKNLPVSTSKKFLDFGIEIPLHGAILCCLHGPLLFQKNKKF